MKRIEQLKPVETIPNNGFMGIACCNCGSRHVYHYRIDRGTTPAEDVVIISHFRDWNYEKLTGGKKCQ